MSGGRWFRLAAFAALGYYAWAGVSFIRGSSPTYDEPLHLASGYGCLTAGGCGINLLDHPPLAEMAAGAALLGSGARDLKDTDLYRSGAQYPYADRFLYANEVPAAELMRRGRLLSFFLWSALLLGAVFLFTRGLGGTEAGLAAVTLLALTPGIVSNFSLVATDAAAAALYICAFWLAKLAADALCGGRRHLPLFAAAGACAGAAMAAKFSMAPLPGFAALAVLLHVLVSEKRPPKGALAAAAAVYLAALCAAVCLVYLAASPADYLKGLAATSARLAQGRPSFVAGRYSLLGVTWYFPYALLVKTPPALLALAALGAAFSVRGARRDHLWLYLPAVLYFEFALTAKVQIGYRHILPVLPFLAAAGGIAAARLARARAGAAAAALLFAFTAADAAAVHPFYLSYFSPLAGGSAGGWLRLADSNLDWGQDLPELARALDARGAPPVYLSYFGTARPEAYGIRYVPFATASDLELAGGGPSPCAAGRPLVAVSVTSLQAVYNGDKDYFSWLKRRVPAFKAGGSIFVYDLSGDKAGLLALASRLAALGVKGEADCLSAMARRLPQGSLYSGPAAGVGYSASGQALVCREGGAVEFPAGREISGGAGAPLASCAVSPSGTVAWGGMDGGVWTLRAGIPRRLSSVPWGAGLLRYSSDGRLLAAAGEGPAVRIYAAADGRLLRELRGAAARPAGLDFSPDGRLLAAAGQDGAVTLWDLASGRPAAMLRGGRNGFLTSLAASPGGGLLAYGGWDGAVTVLESASGAVRCRLDAGPYGVTALAFQDGGTELLTGDAAGGVLAWDARACRRSRRLSAAGGTGVTSLAGYGGRALAGFSDGRTAVLR